MKQKTKVAKSFYEKRSLTQPQSEWWPSNAGELREAIRDSDGPRLLVGDGQHTRPAAIEVPNFDVIRTEQCRRVMSVDRESKLIRVESGLRWSDLEEEARERGLTMERYRLYPQASTIGGLMGRFEPTHRELWDGDLRTGCIALTGAGPQNEDFRYIAAPRKASGPDMRWMFMGSEGALGAILDATLIAWEPADGRLVSFKPERFGQAAAIVQTAWDLGIRPSWTQWTNYKTSPDELLMALHGPARLLDASISALIERHDVPYEVGGNDDVHAKRLELEASHPDRRTLATAKRTVHAIFSNRDVATAIDNLPSSVEAVSIWHWTRHTAHVYIRYARGKTMAELPAAIANRALDVRPVVDDEAVRWPRSSHALKELLDPNRRLAVGG